MPGAISVDLVPDVNPGEWQAAMLALANQATQSMAAAGVLAGQAFSQGFSVAALGEGGAASLYRSPTGRLVSPANLGGAIAAGGSPSRFALPPAAPRLGPLRNPETGQFVSRSTRFRSPQTGQFISTAAAIDAGLVTGQVASVPTDYRARTTGPSPYAFVPPGYTTVRGSNVPYYDLYGDTDVRFAQNYQGRLGGANLALYDPAFAAEQRGLQNLQRGNDTFAPLGAGRRRTAYFDEFERVQRQGFDIGGEETEDDFRQRRIAERQEQIRAAEGRASGRYNPFRRGGILGGRDVGGGRGTYNANARQVRLGDFLLGSATGLPGPLRNVALGTGFTARFGGALGFAGLGVGVGAGVSGLLFNRFRTGPGGPGQVGDIGANRAFNDLVEGATEVADVLATQFGPGLVSAVEGLADFAQGLANFFGGAGDVFDRGQGSLSGVPGFERYAQYLDDNRLARSALGAGGSLITYLGLNRTDDSTYGNFNTARTLGFNANTLPDRPISAGTQSSNSLALLNRRFAIATEQNLEATEQRYTGLLSERLQIERALTDQMHAELNARLNLTQHLATEALDLPTEQLSLNEAIANLRNSAGQQARTSGTLAQREALRGVLDVAGGFAGLEGGSLTALSAAARRAGESQRSYIRSFIERTTGFNISNEHLDLIQQQIGSAGAREQQEDLSLRREQLNLTRTNNDNLDALNLNVEGLSETIQELSFFTGNQLGPAGHLSADYEDPSPLFDANLALEGASIVIPGPGGVPSSIGTTHRNNTARRERAPRGGR